MIELTPTAKWESGYLNIMPAKKHDIWLEHRRKLEVPLFLPALYYSNWWKGYEKNKKNKYASSQHLVNTIHFSQDTYHQHFQQEYHEPPENDVKNSLSRPAPVRQTRGQ